MIGRLILVLAVLFVACDAGPVPLPVDNAAGLEPIPGSLSRQAAVDALTEATLSCAESGLASALHVWKCHADNRNGSDKAYYYAALIRWACFAFR